MGKPPDNAVNYKYRTPGVPDLTFMLDLRPRSGFVAAIN